MSYGDYYGRMDYACLKPDGRNMFRDLADMLDSLIKKLLKGNNKKQKIRRDDSFNYL